MDQYAEMSLSEVVDEVIDRIHVRMDQSYETDYPDRPVSAVLSVLDKAKEYAASNSIVGFAVASSFLNCVVENFKVQLPEGLSDRLHARVVRS